MSAAIGERKQLSIEQRPPRLLITELQRTLQTFSRETAERRLQFAEKHIIPRLRALAKLPTRRTTFETRRELYQLLTDFMATSSAAVDLEDILAEPGLEVLLQEPVAPIAPALEESDVTERLPQQLGMSKDYKYRRAPKAPARQPRDKSLHRQSRQHEHPTNVQHLDTDLAESLPALHEQLFGEQGGIRRLTATGIFGPTLTDKQLISKDPGLVEQRLTHVQESLSSSQLVDRVLQTINDFLRNHKASLRETDLIQSTADKDYFPNDDLVDAALRRYLQALFDWFPHVYNATLDYPQVDGAAKRKQREYLRYFLIDGLEKSLGVMYKIFPHEQERELGSQLNRQVNEVVQQHYFAKPEQEAA